jgi:uncharacterized protein (TIGR02588 family)
MPDHRPSDTQRSAHQTDRKAPKNTIPVLEWIASALGLMLVVGALGLIVYDAFVPDTPLQLTAETTRIMAFEGRYLVEVMIRNNGGLTAAQVNVEGTLKQRGKKIEVASTTFDYVPAYSSAKGGLFFTHNPRTYPLQLRANAYQEP